MSETPYNPLDKRNLADSVVDAMLSREIGSLPPAEPFEGAGIYALYYTGTFTAYRRIAEQNRDDMFLQPIYVGKAVPPGARKGGFGLGAAPGKALFNRLQEHASSVEQAENLELSDFKCRYLVVDDIWIPLAESLLIETFKPIWNHLIDGFGNHDPGSGRYNQYVSRWDVLHPGRSWAERLRPRNESAEEIIIKAEQYLLES
ncbi:MAG: Eco29kI family restriction endonuclease [Solirubrobacterales bacterium]